MIYSDRSLLFTNVFDKYTFIYTDNQYLNYVLNIKVRDTKTFRRLETNMHIKTIIAEKSSNKESSFFFFISIFFLETDRKEEEH